MVNHISTDVKWYEDVKLTVSEALSEVMKSAVAVSTVSTDITDANNPSTSVTITDNKAWMVTNQGSQGND